MRFRTKPVHFSIVCVILKQYLSNVHCFTCITFTLNFSNSSFSSQQRCYYRGLTVQYDTEIRLQRAMVLYNQRRYVTTQMIPNILTRLQVHITGSI